MGLIIDGQWVDKWYDTKNSDGQFVRQDSAYRGSINNQANNPYQVEAGRYHLYVSLACPWAHRALIFRQLKGLTGIISVSVVEPEMLNKGWSFAEKGDDLYQLKQMYEIYLKGDSNYQGRVTVPVLWDKKTQTIVNNESSEIIRILNGAFNQLTDNHDDYYPDPLQSEIDEVNQFIYDDINNGVYKAGFATSQAVYESAYHRLFERLDWLELRLSQQRYLVGEQITEADWRLFTTLIRFDAVYHGHFKCNRQTLASFKHISGYLRELYQIEGVAETVNFEHIKTHYYYSHDMINPTRIIPAGPWVDFNQAHNREAL
ncbi:glutathione-dependent reductase [Psychromonas sp. psych-6C06]|uniref:glutathione S-transferase family protein n=1 Tax=Psychromonas sp. psych-6C06 TaxID=2058089 RepID=UPI000C340851|nr:glutathione S-transferase family protein [Psychromonas sp. psych-6C06]PKF61196.1 glutathione-dependent reductase [Psychromonas sp. psych-6C06]